MFASDLMRGRTILITGGGTGLGMAMALRFGQLGAKVGVLGRREEPLRQVCDAISDAAGPEGEGPWAAWASADVRDRDSVEAALESIEGELGPLTDLVNNAAGNFLCASEDLSPRAFDAIVQIVLYGTFNVTQALGKRWIARGHPGPELPAYSVLSIVTTYAWMGSPFVLPSACAKAGVLALTRSLATEWASYGVRLNAIAPGPFPTEGAFSRLAMPGAEALGPKRIPLGRHGQPSELADLAVYLSTAAYITGDCVTIDGGEWLRVGQEFGGLLDLPRAQVKQALEGMRPKKPSKPTQT